MSRGELRIYLGAAPGVGKTFAMLNEGRRRHERGTDVVVGFVETHGRANTAAQMGDLPVVPRRTHVHRGATLQEMDLDAVLARNPTIALVDELAHTNAPGSRHAKRWEDVEELLAAGIGVITTVNVQHLESLNDVVERITGVRQHETVPDHVVRAADQIEIIDMTPEALRRRMAHGNIYAPDRVDAALANYFRPGNLAALRELALLWVADRVDEGLHEYMEAHGIDAVWETRERVVVAVTGAPGGDNLVRRAARMAARSKADLLAVHVQRDDGLAERDHAGRQRLAECRQLVGDLGGSWHETVGSDVATALCHFARTAQATQLVIGASRRSRLTELTRGSLVASVLRQAGSLDVHVFAGEADAETSPAARPRLRVRRMIGGGPLPVQRVIAGWVIVAAGIPALTGILTGTRAQLNLACNLLLYLLVVLAAATVGGVGPALVASVAASLVANWFFVPPYHTLTISALSNVLSLVTFLIVGSVVAVLVTVAARRRAEAKRARAEAGILAQAAAELVAQDEPVPAMLRQVCTTFGLRGASVLIPGTRPGRWQLETADGADPPMQPDEADDVIPLADGAVLAIVGERIRPEDRHVLEVFCLQVASARQRQRLQHDAARAEAVAQADGLRTALLRAVSHDLRSPLASIKAAVTSLLQRDVAWSPTDVEAFLATIDEETDRLDRLVGDLLDMSRLQAGSVHARHEVVALEDIVAASVASLSPPPTDLELHLPPAVPAALGDPALLERVVANVLANAATHGSHGHPIVVDAAVVGGKAHLRIVDRGPGVPVGERVRILEPFQRLDDRRSGVGLGLAVARGFMEVMGGDLVLEDTPGGGLTVDLVLDAAAPEPVPTA